MFSPGEVEAQHRSKAATTKKVITGKSLADLYTKFSATFRKLPQGEIVAILQNLKNKELISNANKGAFEKLVAASKNDGKDVVHEIFIYFGAFPLAQKKKEQDGIRTSIAQTFQTLVLKNKKVDKDMLAADVAAMGAIAKFMQANPKATKLPEGLIPALPKPKKKK